MSEAAPHRPTVDRKRSIAILSTGGTIEKTYNESDGTLANQQSVLNIMLASLVLRGVRITRVSVMNKDSLEMSADDHARIVAAVDSASSEHDGLIITHGTDRLANTGESICAELGSKLTIPVVITGAMRPYELRNTDAIQNLTEALLAVQMLGGGVYCVMHNQVLKFPGVVKDYDNMSFRYADDSRA